MKNLQDSWSHKKFFLEGTEVRLRFSDSVFSSQEGHFRTRWVEFKVNGLGYVQPQVLMWLGLYLSFNQT